MGNWKMHQKIPSDLELGEYFRRAAQREALIRHPGTIPEKLGPGERARWLDLERQLKAKFDSITGGRRSKLVEEIKSMIKENYEGNTSEISLQIPSEAMADYCIAYKLFPHESNESCDEATEQEKIHNKHSDRGAWPDSIVNDRSNDKLVLFLQQAYIHRVTNAAFPSWWLHKHFPDVYEIARKTAGPESFSEGFTQLLKKNIAAYTEAMAISKELPSWFSQPSKYAGYREKAERHGTGKELVEHVVTYFGIPNGEEIRSFIDTDTKRKALFFLTKGHNYKNMDAIAEIAAILQAIIEAGDASMVLIVAWIAIDQRANDNDEGVRANLEALYKNGAQALNMGLDQVL